MAEKKSSEEKETRTRTWTFVVYPDSAPENWQDSLDELHIPWVCSPLHDKDVNGDGSPKKPHWHVLFLFGSVKSYEQVKELTDRCNAPIPQRVHDAKAMVRYMAHLDNPSKAQYSVSDIVGHSGADVADMLRPSSSERYDHIAQMMDYIDDNHVIEFQDLLRYARRERRSDWFPLLCDSCAYVVGQYIKSQRHRTQPKIQPSITVDPKTGEVIEPKTGVFADLMNDNEDMPEIE